MAVRISLLAAEAAAWNRIKFGIESGLGRILKLCTSVDVGNVSCGRPTGRIQLCGLWRR